MSLGLARKYLWGEAARHQMSTMYNALPEDHDQGLDIARVIGLLYNNEWHTKMNRAETRSWRTSDGAVEFG